MKPERKAKLLLLRHCEICKQCILNDNVPTYKDGKIIKTEKGHTCQSRAYLSNMPVHTLPKEKTCSRWELDESKNE